MDDYSRDAWKHALSRRASRRKLLKLVGGGALAGGLYAASGTSANQFVRSPSNKPRFNTVRAAEPDGGAFNRVWARTDLPVSEHRISRTWMWGPEAFTEAFVEPYMDSPGEQRLVKYFPKSRMEINNPDGDPNTLWYITNGLLATELITGRRQLGDQTFEQHNPAEVHAAGDPDPDAPTYATFGPLLDHDPLPLGTTITQTVEKTSDVGNDDSLAAHSVSAAHLVPETNHTVASVFWDFMNSSGLVYQNDNFVQDRLFENPFFGFGLPISEAYWAWVKVAGVAQWVLVQAFERRVLTFTPNNPAGWQVEAGNIGHHYYEWRYGYEHAAGYCVPVSAEHKPKANPDEKLRELIDANPVPSVLAGAILQLERRYSTGHAPSTPLEEAVFPVFDGLSPEGKRILGCAVDRFDALPAELRDQIFASEFATSAEPLSVERLAPAFAAEIAERASLELLGDDRCLMTTRPGLERPTGRLNGAIFYNPSICRVNWLRTNTFGLSPDDYFPRELEHECILDDDGALSCSVQTQPPDCPGNHRNNVCLRVPEYLAGETIALTGRNYFNINGRVQLTERETGAITRVIEDIIVCGDTETPATEIVDGVERPIIDCRVEDKLIFELPEDIPAGRYQIQVIMPYVSDNGWEGDFFSDHQFIDIVPSPTTNFQVATEELFCELETNPVWSQTVFGGPDDVGLRIFTIPFGLDGSPGEMETHSFGNEDGIFKGINSGDYVEPVDRVLFNGSGISGLSIIVLGHEVNSVSAWQNEIESFKEAYVHVLRNVWNQVNEFLKSEVGKLILAAVGKNVVKTLLGKPWAVAIAAALGLGILAIFARSAPADLIMEDSIGLTSIDLAMLTSPVFPPPEVENYETEGNIDVTVEALTKDDTQYLENRRYYSRSEGSIYHLTLSYS